MKASLERLIGEALRRLHANGLLGDLAQAPEATVSLCKDPTHGDFACTAAMSLARAARRPPLEIARALATALPDDPLIETVEVAGPGFLNFRLSSQAFQALVGTILSAPEQYGRSGDFEGRRIQVEFVSANPTGPLHVGHGRGAAYGAALAELLAAVGWEVEREYYVNDAGRQMDILAASVWLRCLERSGVTLSFPANAYRGEYIRDIANGLDASLRERLVATAARPLLSLVAPEREPPLDTDEALDELVAGLREAAGDPIWRTLSGAALEVILSDIREDLAEFGVHYDVWFSERNLVDGGAIERALTALDANGESYREGGALWFRATRHGDEKDRVLVRENGQSTYFASDIAYHSNKLERGFERLIDVWGADHHGYISRVKGALRGLGKDPDALAILLVQFANLYRAGERVSMSTRSGEFVTLRELREEVGNDAARFFYVMRKSDQHLDFDLDLAKTKSNENPVFYVQYAHARVASVLRQLREKGVEWRDEWALAHSVRLVEPHELTLLKSLSRFPDVVRTAARDYEPHQVAFYLREVANDFHGYYNAHQFLVEDEDLRNARVGLARATQVVVRNGLTLLGVSAPEAM